MKYYCTLSDFNYLARGCALYNSVAKYGDFTLYYLALDKRCYDKLRQLRLPNVEVYYIEQIPLEEAMKDKFSYEEYCWMLASYFTDYLLVNKNISHIMYLDSDLFFFADPALIFADIGEYSVGISPHRDVSSLDTYYGKYNVGVVYFKGNAFGKSVLRWWRDSVLAKTEGFYGDQKYLDYFIAKFGKDQVCEIDICYIAPWNLRLYVYDLYKDTGKLMWGKELQTLVYAHFSGFEYDLVNGTYHNSRKHRVQTLNYTLYDEPVIHLLYNQYYEAIKAAHKQIERPNILI